MFMNEESSLLFTVLHSDPECFKRFYYGKCKESIPGHFWTYLYSFCSQGSGGSALFFGFLFYVLYYIWQDAWIRTWVENLYLEERMADDGVALHSYGDRQVDGTYSTI